MPNSLVGVLLACQFIGHVIMRGFGKSLSTELIDRVVGLGLVKSLLASMVCVISYSTISTHVLKWWIGQTTHHHAHLALTT